MVRDSKVIEFQGLIDRASRGNRSAADLFYRLFLSTTFYVPERRGAEQLAKDTRYPDSLFTLLGVTVSEITYIPFFLQPDYIEQWCGFSLSKRTMTGNHLLSLAPDGWWLCLNPGQHVEKEFSPWEVETLKKGPEAISELVEELLSDTTPELVSAIEPEEEEFKDIKKVINNFTHEYPQIEKVFLLKEISQVKETERSVPLIGITLGQDAHELAESILSNVRAAAKVAQIGAEEPKVYVGVEGASANIALKLFEFSDPFYIKPAKSSVIAKGINFFSRTFR